jgi:hypothetical protein
MAGHLSKWPPKPVEISFHGNRQVEQIFVRESRIWYSRGSFFGLAADLARTMQTANANDITLVYPTGAQVDKEIRRKVLKNDHE